MMLYDEEVRRKRAITGETKPDYSAERKVVSLLRTELLSLKRAFKALKQEERLRRLEEESRRG